MFRVKLDKYLLNKKTKSILKYRWKKTEPEN